MQNAFLPIDVCEVIIDSCYEWNGGEPRRGSYPFWLRTALVCSAWLPRSRFNLLREVDLKNESHVCLLQRTLCDKEVEQPLDGSLLLISCTS